MSTLSNDPQRDFWRGIADQIGQVTADNFEKQFGKPIDVYVVMKNDDAGGTRPHFGFRHIKPGLMPSAIEASFFEGAIANYRQLLSLVMEALDPRDIPTHQ